MDNTNPDENDRGADGEQAVKLDEVGVLLLVIAAVHVQLLNTLDGQLLLVKGDLIGVRGKLGGISVNVERERGREQDNLDIPRQRCLDTDTLIAKTLLVEHVVGLVQDQHLELGRVEDASLDHFMHGTRGSNHNSSCHPLRASGGICRDRSSNAKAFKELSHHVDDTDDLTCEFTGRSQDQGLRSVAHLFSGQIDTAQDIEDEGGSLASSGLGLSDEVLGWVMHQQRKGTLLHLGGLAEVHGRETLENTRITAQVSL